MANIFETSPVYISIENLRDSTTNEDLKDINQVTDENVSILIWKAQDIIDNLIWDYWIPNIENQETIFPIQNEDWTENTQIPVSIQKATLLLVENLYIWGILNWSAYEVWFSGKVKSETSRGHTVSYFNSSSSAKNPFINDEIMIYLSPYILNIWTQWYR